MLHRWIGQKPLRLNRPVVAKRGRNKDVPVSVETFEIKNGDTFEPSGSVLKSFRDLMEPVGESLRQEDPVVPFEDQREEAEAVA